ncbi:MAG: cell division ATP-binding protein FtsE [Gammaproteobacteria bacterium]|nr:cell division ATP-binding protein FtsE [Gammaproteobacteria bacterium]
MIELIEARKRYSGGQVALDGVNLRVDPGDMVFITGHSGAGKSTLLRLLMLAERCSGGQVRVGGRDLAQLRGSAVARYRRSVGVVFQDHRLLMDRSIEENVALPLVISGFPSDEIGRRVRAALDRVGLLAKGRAYPIQLSSGEQQRVGIARAVVHKPPLVLADEPTGNLDPELSQETITLFERFSQVGVTVIVATHDLGLVRAMGRRRITLHQGMIVDDTLPA